MSVVYRCHECGFMVPAGDQIGVAIMRAHLREHDRERSRAALAQEDDQ